MHRLFLLGSLAVVGTLVGCASSESGGATGIANGGDGGIGGAGGGGSTTTSGGTTGATTGGMTGGMGAGGSSSGGNGGEGALGGGGLGGMSTSSGSTGGMGGMMGTSSASTGGGSNCQTCSEFAVDPVPIQSNLCDSNGPPASLDIWLDLRSCICVTACPTVCATSLCDDLVLTPDAACQTCLDDQAAVIAACPTEANACLGDI